MLGEPCLQQKFLNPTQHSHALRLQVSTTYQKCPKTTYVSWDIMTVSRWKHVALSLFNWWQLKLQKAHRFGDGSQEPATDRAEKESSYKQSIRKCMIQNRISASTIAMVSTPETCKIYERKYSLDLLASLWYEKQNPIKEQVTQNSINICIDDPHKIMKKASSCHDRLH